MEVEWLILGDFATVIGNKLFLQGGGWDKLHINKGFPATHNVGIAASFIVPWTETNQLAKMEIEVLTEDGGSVAKIKGEFKVGRPADHPEGQDQRTQVAANLPLKLETPGTYEIVARLDGKDEARTTFNVVPGPMLAMKQQQLRSEGDQGGGGDGS